MELEDEFRAALRIEESRYSDLQQSYASRQHEQKLLTDEVAAHRDKEARATAIITELTQLVKDLQAQLEQAQAENQQLFQAKVQQQADAVKLTDRLNNEAQKVVLAEKELEKMQRHVALMDAEHQMLREVRLVSMYV